LVGRIKEHISKSLDRQTMDNRAHVIAIATTHMVQMISNIKNPSICGTSQSQHFGGYVSLLSLKIALILIF
jgi:hypothetical protein